jgi:predicted RNA methylase
VGYDANSLPIASSFTVSLKEGNVRTVAEYVDRQRFETIVGEPPFGMWAGRCVSQL